MNRGELAFALALALVFAPGLAALANAWSSLDYQSHGFLVPIVSLLAARQLARRGPTPRRDGRGALLVAASLLLYGLGFAAGSVTVQGLALCGAVAGAVWYLRGPAWLRRLAFPLGYLLFLVPLPPTFVAALVVPLLAIVTAGSVAVLGALGAGVAREGNVIVLPGGEALFVAEACSGLTSLVTLIPIAVLIAWLAPLAAVRRLALVAVVVPVALGANLLRVVATVLGARAFGVEAVTTEPAHSLLGLSVYVVGCLLLLAAARGLAPPRALSRAAAPRPRPTSGP
ncbi:MAG TPA: exosortase/archaeosortase family protein [Myxococcota bacterium]